MGSFSSPLEPTFATTCLSSTLPGLEKVEADTLALASAVGLPAATKRKYDQTAKQTIDLFRAAEHTEPDIEYSFLRQLAFNTMIGNADAHTKNYSVLLRPDRISLAPLYDALPVILYPEYDQNLAMDISGARRSSAASLDYRRTLARTTGLDIDRVEHGIRTLAAAMTDAIHIQDHDVRVANATTAELLRELTIDPERDYQPHSQTPECSRVSYVLRDHMVGRSKNSNCPETPVSRCRRKRIFLRASPDFPLSSSSQCRGGTPQ